MPLNWTPAGGLPATAESGFATLGLALVAALALVGIAERVRECNYLRTLHTIANPNAHVPAGLEWVRLPNVISKTCHVIVFRGGVSVEDSADTYNADASNAIANETAAGNFFGSNFASHHRRVTRVAWEERKSVFVSRSPHGLNLLPYEQKNIINATREYDNSNDWRDIYRDRLANIRDVWIDPQVSSTVSVERDGIFKCQRGLYPRPLVDFELLPRQLETFLGAALTFLGAAFALLAISLGVVVLPHHFLPHQIRVTEKQPGNDKSQERYSDTANRNSERTESRNLCPSESRLPIKPAFDVFPGWPCVIGGISAVMAGAVFGLGGIVFAVSGWWLWSIGFAVSGWWWLCSNLLLFVTGFMLFIGRRCLGSRERENDAR
jgi:hypothetical protein